MHQHCRVPTLTVALACALLAAAPGARAVVVAPGIVPAAVGTGFVANGGGTNVYGPALDAISGSGVNLVGASFTNSASSLLVDGNPTAAVAGTAGAWAQAILDFYFVVQGPEGTQVPVTVTGTVSATRPAGSTANLQAVISRADEFLVPIDPMLVVCFGSADPECSRGSGTLTRTGTLSYTVEANVPQAVFMFASIDARSATSGSFSAWADPTVRIDPAFAGASAYTLLLSPGITPAVPEPASALLLLAGLAGLGRRRRRPPRSPTAS